MKIYNIKSHAKINLSLNITGKFFNNMHKVESIVSFIKLADLIKISEIKSKNHVISFQGKFSKGISKKNSITKVLYFLDQKNYLGNKKYRISVTKNIPQKSGMGGGSMNSAAIINFFLKKKFISSNEAKRIAKKIDSDTILGLNSKSKILYCDNSITEIKKKINFYVVLVKPKFGCSTKKIYLSNKVFTKRKYFKNKKLKITRKIIANSKNDLEKSAFKLYPILANLKKRLISLNKGEFLRLTGSGSAIVVYFNSKVSAEKAVKIYNRKLNKTWCILSKII